MNVGTLKRLLADIPDDTVVVKFHAGRDGYDEIHFVEGTHKGHGNEDDYLKINRAKRVKGESRPDFMFRENARPSRAERVPFLLFH